MNGYVWKITVGNTYVGVANTEDRFKLLEQAVDNGIIPADYNITDVKMEIIKMNERIKELMFDAGLNSNYVEGFDSIYSKQLEKFAELIVRECADVGSKFSQAHPEDICYQIKRHFGVEE